MLNSILKKYKAKSDNTTIYQHNQDLINILNQLKQIHNIDEQQCESLIKSILYHDIGKITEEFQNNIEDTHRKIRHEILSASVKDLSEYEKLSILLHHKTLDWLQKYIGNKYYEGQLKEVSQKLNIETEDIMIYLRKICRTSHKNHKSLSSKELILQLGYLKLCDHIASAGIKNIDKGFYAKDIYNFEKYRSIQQKVLDLEEAQDIIIQAPTGLGKTETSLLWSDKCQNKDKSKRIFYLLPYTASINALYKRLKQNNISVGVLHSKVRSLLYREDDITDIKEEIQLFKKNIKQVTICTIFQIIKAVFQCKNFEMMLAQFKDSIFIIDEIHCFDIREFTLLLETLKYLKDNFNINICIMSASIPTVMLNQIKNTLNINTIITADKEDFLIRHKVNYIEDYILNNLKMIENDLISNKQVLVCVNRVDTNQELYTYFKNKFPKKNIKLIHGKFNARDRSKIEKDLKNCDLLIGTQVIEVSLDINYDVLYTEIAPFDALLQRFGRVNRKGVKRISDIYIFNQSKKSIYRDDIICYTKNVIYKIICENKGMIKEDKVITYLDLVYQDFDIENYNTYKKQFNTLINTLKVGYFNENATDSMLENNNTYSVLPLCLLRQYNQYINDNNYIKANELFVNTYLNKFKEGKEWYYDKNFKIYISYFKYNENIGLTKEIDNDNFII
ncbi:TPA: CRISPR-associated helicase Cas3' [Clostridium botulinum]